MSIEELKKEPPLAKTGTAKMHWQANVFNEMPSVPQTNGKDRYSARTDSYTMQFVVSLSFFAHTIITHYCILFLDSRNISVCA